MPIKKASAKHVRQTISRGARNLNVKRTTKQAVQSARKSITGKTAESKASVLAAIQLLDKAARKGVIKKNTASRKKSRLMKALNKAK
ncbi:MAG: 30S ribosomal protein S20 [Patescibacteria group bacterium]|jgi:small subunit ribosomal protein S20